MFKSLLLTCIQSCCDLCTLVFHHEWCSNICINSICISKCFFNFLRRFSNLRRSFRLCFLENAILLIYWNPKKKVIRRAKLDIHCSGQMVIDDLHVFYITFFKILCIKYHTLIYSKTIFIFFDCFKIISNKDDVAN